MKEWLEDFALCTVRATLSFFGLAWPDGQWSKSGFLTRMEIGLEEPESMRSERVYVLFRSHSCAGRGRSPSAI
jgi:hypothetical protein